MIAATIVSLVLAVVFFLFPSKVVSAGKTNITNSKLPRMSRVFDLTKDNVMILHYPYEEDKETLGLSLTIRILECDNPVKHCSLPDSGKLVFSIMDEDGETILSDSISLNTMVVDVSKPVEYHFRFASKEIEKGDDIRIFFALQNVPDDVKVCFYGYRYDEEDDELDSLAFENSEFSNQRVPFYRVLTEGKDTSMTMLFLIVAFVLAEGSVLYFFGEKHDR